MVEEEPRERRSNPNGRLDGQRGHEDVPQEQRQLPEQLVLGETRGLHRSQRAEHRLGPCQRAEPQSIDEAPKQLPNTGLMAKCPVLERLSDVYVGVVAHISKIDQEFPSART